MKLSEAIRKGCEGTKQYRGWYASKSGKSLCALGAAMRGIGIEPPRLNDGEHAHFSAAMRLYMNFPILRNQIVGSSDLEVAIEDLNDEYHWTREQIADWLESHGE